MHPKKGVYYFLLLAASNSYLASAYLSKANWRSPLSPDARVSRVGKGTSTSSPSCLNTPCRELQPLFLSDNDLTNENNELKDLVGGVKKSLSSGPVSRKSVVQGSVALLLSSFMPFGKKQAANAEEEKGPMFDGLDGLDFYEGEGDGSRTAEMKMRDLIENGDVFKSLREAQEEFKTEGKYNAESYMESINFWLEEKASELSLDVIIASVVGSIVFTAGRKNQPVLPRAYDLPQIETHFNFRPELVVGRLFEILSEYVNYRTTTNFLSKSDQKEESATILRETITRLGPAFIKLGQFLGSRADIVGDENARELEKLQDALPFFESERAMRRIKNELGASADTLFAWISPEPVAAASLGQVYKAELYDGTEVAVKVQRPGLVSKIALDFYVVRLIAGYLQKKEIKSDLVALVDDFAARLFEELDYEIEADNMERFAGLYGGMEGIMVPRVYRAFSSKRVITTEWIYGEKIMDNEHEEVYNTDPGDLNLIRVGIECTLQQLLGKGFMHADPHGGNLLRTNDQPAKLAYLDFGLVSEIPPTIQDSLMAATIHLINRDYMSLARGFPGLSLMSQDDLDRDVDEFAKALEEAFEPLFKEAKKEGKFIPKVSFAALTEQIVALARKFNFVPPPYFISNLRALGEFEGIAMKVDPEFSMLAAIYPYVLRRLLYSPESSPRLRRATRRLLLDPKGHPRWNLIDSMLQDSKVLRSATQPMPTKEEIGKSVGISYTPEKAGKRAMKITTKGNDPLMTRREPRAISKRSPKETRLDLVTNFICSKEGAFLRQVFVKETAKQYETGMNEFIDNVQSKLIPKPIRPMRKTPLPGAAAAAAVAASSSAGGGSISSTSSNGTSAAMATSTTSPAKAADSRSSYETKIRLRKVLRTIRQNPMSVPRLLPLTVWAFSLITLYLTQSAIGRTLKDTYTVFTKSLLLVTSVFRPKPKKKDGGGAVFPTKEPARTAPKVA